jgi:hypothetical protein
MGSSLGSGDHGWVQERRRQIGVDQRRLVGEPRFNAEDD